MDPKKIHQLDQETGPLDEFAVKLAAYKRSLVRQGFSEDEAMKLVLGYQSEIVRSAALRGR